MFSIAEAVRPSGSVLTEAVYKRCKNAVEQAALMQEHPATFAPILAHGCGGYAMPVLQPLRSTFDARAALEVLERYWSYPSNLRVFCSRQKYQDYVHTLPADKLLHNATNHWYYEVEKRIGTPAHSLHGDATLENVMLYGSYPRWIDPNPRIVPAEIELDCGKLLQTSFGYHDCTAGVAETIGDFIRSLNVNLDLTYYYFATHLVRLWRYQPQHHAWAVAVAREVLHA